ncbi:dTDP-4-dehydrorhamnose reductase [Pisciglobus halotolerans]|uniref:dTDP-4-dehydrorhamnose reductase n=1 Tax=Pisciglobus halotolerans TaxID=745365 RepID=A0A1I3DJ53_9LACT|nr:dTDP-4-dehydrorhamnose reductase [Pisciglobus halotolerans]SFH86755.1 dTDP-4-dehydrorhamnose reductase [Pisciglobus halotolerans]
MVAMVTGANGQLGQELCRLLDEKNIDYIAAKREELDITNNEAVDIYVDRKRPDVIYHCAAYTAVDLAEDEGKEQNWLVNVEGTKNIARAAEKVGATLVYISTDYVFDGTNEAEYTENDVPNPKNEYGKAKLAGELAVKKYCTHYYIIRTSWVFGQYGKNFVYTMMNLAKTHSTLTVVNDQIGRPTWTRTLAEFMIYLIEKNPVSNIYQLANQEKCSWYEFAQEILKDKDVEIKPVTSAEYPQKAYRPKHSVMDLSKAEELGFNIISWKEALKQFLAEVSKSS